MAKAKNKNDDLIKSLGEDLKPVKPLGCPARRTLPWIAFSALYAAIIIHYVGMRPDLVVKLHDGVFMFEIILVGITAILAAGASVYMSVPDMCGQKWLKPTALSFIAVFFLWAFTQWFSYGMPMPEPHWDHCINQSAIIALLPIAMLLYIAKRGTTTTPVMMSIMNVASVGALAYIALRLTCMVDDVGHIFFFHVIPFLIAGTLLGVMARKIYKW